MGIRSARWEWRAHLEQRRRRLGEGGVQIRELLAKVFAHRPRRGVEERCFGVRHAGQRVRRRLHSVEEGGGEVDDARVAAVRDESRLSEGDQVRLHRRERERSLHETEERDHPVRRR